MTQQAICQCAVCRADRIVRSLALALTFALIVLLLMGTAQASRGLDAYRSSKPEPTPIPSDTLEQMPGPEIIEATPLPTLAPNAYPDVPGDIPGVALLPDTAMDSGFPTELFGWLLLLIATNAASYRTGQRNCTH